MSLFTSIESIVNNHFEFAALILNNSGLIEVTNREASALFMVDKSTPFFNIFDGENSIIAERVFLESKNNDREAEEVISYRKKSTSGNNDFLLQISPFNINKENYFFVSLKENDKKNRTLPQNKIKTFSQNELKYIKNPDVINVVEKIKSSYPFTLIEKKRLQKEIDNLESAFWIKDANGELIIINKRLKALLNLSNSKYEGKNSKDIFPTNVGEFFETTDEFIKKTLNGIVLEGISDNFNFDSKSKTQIIKLPISDAEKNIVVTVGFTNNIIESDQNYDIELILSDIINIIPNGAALFNKYFDVKLSNNLFIEMFNVSSKNKLLNLRNILPSDLMRKIELQMIGKVSDESTGFAHQLIIGEKLSKVIIKTKRLQSQNDNEQYLLLINPKENKILPQSVKNKMYDIIMKASPEPIFIYEIENLKFIDVNDAALQMYGYSRDKFLQMDLTDLYAPEDIQSLLETTNDIKKLNGKFTGPWRHKRKDGSSILVEISKTEIEHEGKKAHLNIIRDVTSKIDKEKELQLFKTSFENSRDLIILTDAEGFITFVNEPVNKALGFFDAELEKRPFLSLLSDGDRAKVNTNIFHSGTNEVNTFDIRLKNSEGKFIDSKIIATPILNFRNEVELFSLILQLNEADREVQTVPSDAVEVKSQSSLDPSFLSNLFHELLTPINVIIGFVQELLESIDDPTDEQKESADIIRENQKVLLQTMDTAVEFSHLTQENIELKSDKIVFVDILDSLEEDTRKEAVSQKLELSYSKISSSLSIVTDKHRFMTLITLFIQSAMKMTKEKKLLLSAYNYGNDSFVISLKDNRKGITPHLLKNLRELFTADESIIKHTFGISRFSVRLIRKLTSLLAERREVVSKKDNPFEFGIVFPIELKTTTSAIKNKDELKSKTDDAEVEAVTGSDIQQVEQFVSQTKQETSEAVATKSEFKDIDFSQLSCLYVEDQIDSQILFKVQMKELKSIEFATNFEDAIPLLNTKSFNFIVMDINLQGEYNGLDALHIIRKMPVYQDVPVIAVSAYVLPGDRENFIAAGFDDFITKPVLQDKLYDSLRKIIQ